MASSGKESVITLKVKHEIFDHIVKVPSSASVAELKEALVAETRLPAEQQRLIFRGKILGNDQMLESVGVKDRCKLMLMEEHRPENGPEPADEAPAGEASEDVRLTEESQRKVGAVHAEVDKLERQVAKLREGVEKGEKAGDREFVVAGELLMRQLLALDSIKVTQESRALRKAEVNRVQSLVDEVDRLKAANSAR